MNSTANVSTHEPRVHLPGPATIPVPAIATALANFVRLDAGRDAALAASVHAKRAVLDGQAAHSQALAAALVSNTTEPRRNARSTEDAAAAALARFEAFRVAVRLAHGQLAAVVVEHAEAWAAEVSTDHLAAVARYEAAVSEARAAARDLVATGAVLGMLAVSPGSLVAGRYYPAAYLSETNAALDVAAEKVREHAPVLPEPEVEPEVDTEAEAALGIDTEPAPETAA